MLLQVRALKGNSRSPLGAFSNPSRSFIQWNARMIFGFIPIPPGVSQGKNNKYGKHSIQNNMFIQRPVDLRGVDGPPLMWSAASACVCVFRACVRCLRWTCETREENLHKRGPGTPGRGGRGNSQISHVCLLARLLCVRVCACA